ncbi:C-type lectin domain family 10 member A-like [Panthera onca]
MSMQYEKFQHSETEKQSQGSRNGPPPPLHYLQGLCSGPRPFLLSLGISLLLLVGICVIGSQNSKCQRDLVTLGATFSNFTSSTEAELQALNAQGGSLQETTTSLKAEVENHKRELQAARSLNDKVFALESKLEKDQRQLQADHSDTLARVQQLAKDLRTLTCQVAALKSNGSQSTCCPVNWLEFEGSCYWFSRSGETWPEAEKHCRLENAHLVVVNSREEENFVQEHIGSLHVWMGLSDAEGAWKWVDGTDYATNFKNWRPGQPDDWHGHGLGGGEDCAHFHPDGWNDDVCQRPYRWVCEARLGVAG